MAGTRVGTGPARSQAYAEVLGGLPGPFPPLRGPCWAACRLLARPVGPLEILARYSALPGLVGLQVLARFLLGCVNFQVRSARLLSGVGCRPLQIVPDPLERSGALAVACPPPLDLFRPVAPGTGGHIHNHQSSGHLLNHGAGLVLGGPSFPGSSGPWTPLLSSSRMGATVFVQPLDLVKNRMQLSGEGAKTREYKTSFHALTSILRAEGLRGIYTGYGGVLVGEGGLAAPGPGLTP